MATLQQVIQLVFEGVDNASDVAKNISKSLEEVNDAAKDISQPFADLAEKTLLVQAAFLGLGGVIATLAYKEAVEFESSLLDLQKQMEDGEGSARDFAATLEKLALKYGVNVNELIKNTADFKAAGYDLKTSTDLVEKSLKLVIAGGLDTAESVKVMNRALAGFDIQSSDVINSAQKIGDILNKTADITKSSFGDLATGFADLSPIAKLTGLSFEETAAILSKVIDVFGSGSEAANALKSGLLAILDPSEKAATELARLGVKFDAAGRPIGTIKDLLAIIGPAFEKMDQSSRLAAAGIIFSSDQAAKMVTVLGRYSSAMDLADRITREATGSIQKEVDLRLKSAEQTIKSTGEAWQQFLRVLGDEIRINTTGVISGLGALALKFREVVESGKLDPLFKLLRSQLGELENILKTVAMNIPAAFKGIDFSGLVKAFENLGINARKALEALFGPIDLRTVDGLRDALQQVVDILAGLVRLTAGELGGLAPFLAGIRQLAGAFKDANPDAQQFSGTILGFMSGLNSASGMFESINTGLLAFIAFGPKLTAWGASAAAAAAALAGPQGLAVLLGAAAASIVTFLVPAEKLADYAWPDWLAGYEGATPGTAIADIAEGFSSLTTRIGNFVNQSVPKLQEVPNVFDEQTTAIRETRTEINSWLDAQETAAKQTKDTSNEIKLLTDYYLELGYTYDANTGSLTKLNAAQAQSSKDIYALAENIRVSTGAVEDARNKNGYFSGSLERIVTNYEQIGGGTVKATGAFKAVKDKTEEAKKALDGLIESGKLTTDQFIEVTKNANDFKSKMEEIASNERIKTIEAVVDFKIANVEADAKRVIAAFESIDATVQSTGDLIGSLFSDLVGTEDIFKASFIRDQIEIENKRRQEALDIQKKLAEAEISRIEAQTRQLDRGDPWIRIDGTSLQPQLEAFMWEILKAIRTQVSAEFSQFLLGVA